MEWIDLNLLVLNSANPRTISVAKMEKLVDSILCFPNMLELRPIVLDADMTILGGNQRTKALLTISDMTSDALEYRVKRLRNFKVKSKGDQKRLLEFWMKWLGSPKAPVAMASKLTDDEKQEFIIRDNVDFGDWSKELLKQFWDTNDLNDWGLDLNEWEVEDKADEDEEEEEPVEEPEDDGEDFDFGEESFGAQMIKDVLYETDNDMDIPLLLMDRMGGKVELPFTPWGANSRLRKDVATYHFYVDDYRFEKLFRDPINLVTSNCKAIVEPNCSLHDQTPIAYGLNQIYKKRYLARYMQELGVQVFVDLNVAEKFRAYNQMGVPKGWNAFFTRGLTDFMVSLDNDLKQAQEISGLEKPNLIVYGGGKKVQEYCNQKGLLYIQDFINAKSI